MWYLYLDESGDLGFDYVNRKPSKFFTVTILAIIGHEQNRALINSIKHVFKRKLRKKKILRKSSFELKGSKTSFAIKSYFYNKVSGLDFGLYALTLNKRRLYQYLIKEKERIYNYIARLVLDKIPIEESKVAVELIVDKRKGKPEIEEFNSYIIRHLQGKLDPKVPLNIYHHKSTENLGLQAVDIFSWGIFRKYERKDIS